MSGLRKMVSKAGGVLGAAMLLWGGGAWADDDFTDALTKGKPLLDMRARWEEVEQDGLPRTADALTLRTRLGYETGEYEHVKVLAEFQDIRTLAQPTYNNTYNGKTQYPTIGDPKGTILSRAQLTYTGVPDTTLIVGRQRILIDNQRFIGNAGFRQNEQTFDAVNVVNRSLPGLELQYVYLGQVLRVFGPNSPQGHFDSDSHLLHASYTGITGVTLSAYDYLLDLGPRSPLNTQTAGIRAAGERPLEGWTLLTFAGEFANQKSFRDNPRPIDLNYYFGELGLKVKAASAAVGYEVLGGDLVSGFATPLATLFAFNGWADVFLTTPRQGLKDLYVKAGYIFSDVPVVNKVNAQLAYHTYKPDAGGGGFGHEWNALISLPINAQWTVEARYADYTGGSLGLAGRSKFWLSAQLKI